MDVGIEKIKFKHLKSLLIPQLRPKFPKCHNGKFCIESKKGRSEIVKISEYKSSLEVNKITNAVLWGAVLLQLFFQRLIPNVFEGRMITHFVYKCGKHIYFTTQQDQNKVCFW